MTYANTLKYAGAEPYRPEEDRLPYRAHEALTQDDTYQRLAEVRYLAEELATDLNEPQNTAEKLAGDVWFDAIGVSDAPVHVAVAIYVYEWLRERDWDERAYARQLNDDALDAVDLCRHCHRRYGDCECSEAAEVTR